MTSDEKPAEGATAAENAQDDPPAEASDGEGNALPPDIVAEHFDPDFYTEHYADVIATGIDPLHHYLIYGWREGRQPCLWFDPATYTASAPDLDPTKEDPFRHFLCHGKRNDDGKPAAPEAAPKAERVLHRRVAPGIDGTPVMLSLEPPPKADLDLVRPEFDADYYLTDNPDVAAMAVDPLVHFMTIGWIEGRNPNADFSTAYYLRANHDIAAVGRNPFVHWLRHGRDEKWRQSTDVVSARLLRAFEADPDLVAKVAAAAALEPMVMLPDEQRRVTSPLSGARARTDAAERLRLELAGKKYRHIIAVPHVRMSGAARVASMFARALAEIRDPSSILVVITDASEFEYLDWFPEGLNYFDLSQHAAELDADGKLLLLLDLMRGVGCETLFNINSRLAWDMLALFKRQLPQEFKIVSYLFTWDLTRRGARVGYPIQWLRESADAQTLILTDTRQLSDDIARRMGFDGEEDGRVTTLYTPVDPDAAPQANVAGASERRLRRRVLWTGRFDRQKRLDILVAIARANPGVDFDVYGKSVLDGQKLADFNPPANIREMGTYVELDKVLAEPYCGFVYTAQWDGLPTILLDIALSGLPIVAPDVGGIGEMMDDTTGWLIGQFDDVPAYSAALREMLADPAGAQARAERLRALVVERFARKNYLVDLDKALKRHGI